jgi:UPF0271 protein
MNIDLNCDLGEGAGNDAAIMPQITSANIACGFHAGNANIMQATVRLAKQHNVAIGAHPGWNDLQGFGRREMQAPADEVEALVLYQIGALYAFVKAEGAELRHVKPHGALYNQAAKDRALADAIARAVKRFSGGLILVGLAGSQMIEAGITIGIKVAHEAFPDRGYSADGSLLPRNLPGAVIEEPIRVAQNAIALAKNGIHCGDRIIIPDTLCLHGDNARAVENARALRTLLSENRIRVAAT